MKAIFTSTRTKAFLAATAVLFALAYLAGCNGSAEPPASTQATHSQEAQTTKPPSSPQYPDLPQLTVYQLHTVMSRVLPSVQAIQGVTNWTWENQSVHFDSAHPLQLNLSAFDTATLSDPMIYLSFSYPPEEIIVRRWPTEYLFMEQEKTPFERYKIIKVSELPEADQHFFMQSKGDYIYEVNAQWAETKQSSYAFRIKN